MRDEQHPSDIVLLALAAGTLGDEQREAIARHVSGCERCGKFVRTMEYVGGVLLEGFPPASMDPRSLAAVLTRLEQPASSARPTGAPDPVDQPSESRAPMNRRARGGYGGQRPRNPRRTLLKALPIAAVIVLSIGLSYFLVEFPFSSRISEPPGLKTVAIMGHYQHPVPSDTLHVDERPGYVPPPDDESRPAAYQRQAVFFRTIEPPGTILVNAPDNFLYLVLGNNRALRYAIGVGHDCFKWQGLATVSHKTEWPDWTPSPEALARRPDLPPSVAGGPGNPLGARAIYLSDEGYRIHGTNEPQAIGRAVSSGCFQLANGDIIDLYQRVPVGARVIVEQAPVV